MVQWQTPYHLQVSSQIAQSACDNSQFPFIHLLPKFQFWAKQQTKQLISMRKAPSMVQSTVQSIVHSPGFVVSHNQSNYTTCVVLVQLERGNNNWKLQYQQKFTSWSIAIFCVYIFPIACLLAHWSCRMVTGENAGSVDISILLLHCVGSRYNYLCRWPSWVYGFLHLVGLAHWPNKLYNSYQLHNWAVNTAKAIYVHNILLSYLSSVLVLVPNDHYVTTPGGSARFTCSGTGLTGIQWLVNGTLLENLNLTNVTAAFRQSVVGGIGVLTFENVLFEYNETTIRCSDSSSRTSQVQSKLLIQGNPCFEKGCSCFQLRLYNIEAGQELGGEDLDFGSWKINSCDCN